MILHSNNSLLNDGFLGMIAPPVKNYIIIGKSFWQMSIGRSRVQGMRITGNPLLAGDLPLPTRLFWLHEKKRSRIHAGLRAIEMSIDGHSQLSFCIDVAMYLRHKTLRETQIAPRVQVGVEAGGFLSSDGD